MQHSQKCQEALVEVQAALRADARGIDPHKAAERAHFMKATMPMFGLGVPAQRKLLRRGYCFSHLPFEAQLPLWAHIWSEATHHETRMQAAFFIEKPPAGTDLVWLWGAVKDWVSSVNCWDQSDTLSNLYARINEAHPEQVVPVLRHWNGSDNPWERRQSLVALLCYSRFRRSFPEQALVFELVEALLADPDYYVQKGLGWTLREAWHVWPEPVMALLDRHIVTLAPAAWQAATEKLDPSVKQRLKAKRMAGRKAGR